MPITQQSYQQEISDVFQKAVIERAEAFGFSLFKETLTTYRPELKERVIGIVGIVSEDDFALLQDGACQKDMFFILCDPTGLSVNKGWAYVSHGLTYQNGYLQFVRLPYPSKIHYLVNYDNTPFLGHQLSCPLVIRDELRNYLFDKSVTASILSATGIDTPKEQVLLASRHENNALQPINRDQNPNIYRRRNNRPNVHYVDIDDLNECHFLAAFLDRLDIYEGVIKPNNLGCGEGIFLFNRDNLEPAEQHLKMLLSNQHDVVLQERIKPPMLVKQDIYLDWNLRVFVSRDEHGQAIASDILVRIGEQGKAINVSIEATTCLLEEIACALEWSEQTYGEIKKLVYQVSENAYNAVCKAMLTDSQGTENNLVPDILGIDIILSHHTEHWRAYIIEMDINPGGAWYLNHCLALATQKVNNNSLTQIQQSWFSPQALNARMGNATRVWIKLMKYRCQH